MISALKLMQKEHEHKLSLLKFQIFQNEYP